ncbi:phage tail protein [Clostridium perfringens]|nr:phage tail protein [Clostridium perfringens]
MGKVQLYKFNNKNFVNNGDMILEPSKCTLKMELVTGLNEVTMEHEYDEEERWKYISRDDVIKVSTPYKKIPEQLYRIYDIEKNLDYMSVKARHIFYDLVDIYIKDLTREENIFDVRCVNCNGQQALDKILKGTEFKGHSDIEKIATSYYFRKKIVQAIGGDDKENSFLSRWGGELFLNNFDIYLNKRVGEDNNVRIAYKKNLTGLVETIDMDSLITRVIPTGYDGICISGTTPWVDSPLINNYSHVFESEQRFEDIKLKGTQNNKGENAEGFDTQEQVNEALKNKGKELISKGIDKPLVNYSVQFIPLSSTEEYKEYKSLEEILLGDTVYIEHKPLDINIKARCISLEYDCLNEEMLNCEIGNYLDTYASAQADKSVTFDTIAGSFDGDGNLGGENIIGAINAMKAPLLAQRDRAKKLDIVAWIQEVLDPNDPDFGCVQGGTKGILLSDKRLSDNSGWDFKTAITPKGIIADELIGILTTVLIRNMDKSFEIDLKKPGGALFRNNGKDAIKIENNMIKLYNWKKNGDYIGALMSLVQGDDENKPLIGLANDIDSAMSLGYAVEGKTKVPSYIALDKYNILDDSGGKPVRIYEEVDFKGNKVYNIDIRSDNGKNNIMVGNHFINITTPDNEIVVAGSGTRIGKDKPLYYNAKTGEVTCNGDFILGGVIKNTNGNLVLDPNAPQGGGVYGSDSLRNSVVNSARKLIGKPYVWGGNYPPLGSDAGTDCSGLMQWAYNDNGIKISRTTYTQIKEGKEVSESELKPGDLIFLRFSSPGVPEHVFMYSGKKNGKHMCVEAPRTGLNIREIEFTWGSNYRARRIIKDTPGGNVNDPASNKASKNIIYYVKGIEGYAPYHYYDSVGVKTLGYGMTGKELNGVSVPLSETSATHYLVNNFNRDYYIPVLNIVKSKGVSNPLQREIDAFASFAYNCGVEGFRNSQLLKRYVNGERGEGIHNEFMKWIHAGSSVSNGLIRRREEEWKIFGGSSSPVGGYNTAPSISYINKAGLPTSKVVTENGGYGASPY